MKKVLAIITLVLLMGPAPASAQDDISKHPACPYCGMDRAKFAHSRMLLEYDGGSALGACSLRCVAVDMALFIDKVPLAIKVGDYDSKELVDAEKAYWVIGGDKMGVMTTRAKWAFKDKKDAEAFIAANGGNLASFEEAMEAAYADMYKDNKMIREKRKMMRMKKMKKSE